MQIFQLQYFFSIIINCNEWIISNEKNTIIVYKDKIFEIDNELKL